ncbi:MAG: HAMP domain-containing sensor histidine kinase [Parvibaculum sp.]
MQELQSSRPGGKTPPSVIDSPAVTRSVVIVFMIASAAAGYEIIHLLNTDRLTQSFSISAILLIICLAAAAALSILSRGRYLQEAIWFVFLSGSLYLLQIIAVSLFVSHDIDLAVQHAFWFLPIEVSLFVTLERRLAAGLSLGLFGLQVMILASFFWFAGINPLTDIHTGPMVQLVLGQLACIVLLGGLAVFREAAMTKAARIAALEENKEALQLTADETELNRQAAIEALQTAEAATRARETFLATMGHELRTPLNAIIGFAQIMEHGLLREPLPKEKEYSSDIRKSGEHMLALVNQLLEFSRLESEASEINLADHSLAEIFDHTARIMHVVADQKSVRLIREWDVDDKYELETDQQAVRQILFNLMSNAIKFTPKGGIVSLHLVRQEEGEMIIEVSDTGIGIAADKLARVCEPFFQIHDASVPNVGGTGLGLSIVTRLANRLNGTVEIDSVLGEGTCVRVRLPSTMKADKREHETMVQGVAAMIA